MLHGKRTFAPIYVADCACGSGLALAKVERYATHEQAAVAFARHQARFESGDDNHRYWIVHGPSGHVVGVNVV